MFHPARGSKPASLIALALFSGIALPAQGRSILRVDSNGGTPYRTIQSAVDAASDGDLILVAPGSYFSFTINGKGLTVRGDPIAKVRPHPWPQYAAPVWIRNTRPDQAVNLSHLSLEHPSHDLQIGAGVVVIESCRGPVLLEATDIVVPGSSYRRPAPIFVLGSDQVALAHCKVTGDPAISAHTSTVLISDSVVQGTHGAVFHIGRWRGGLGVLAQSANVSLSRTPVRGGDGAQFLTILYPGAPAMRLTGSSTVQISGLPNLTISAGGLSQPNHAIDGTGVVSVDQNVRLQTYGGTPTAAGIRLRRRDEPTLSTTGAPPGGNVKVHFAAKPGDLFALSVGLPAVATNAGGLGTLYHSTTVFAPAASGTLANGTFSLTVPVRQDSSLRGHRLVWQGIAGSPSRGFLLSNPASYTH